MNDLDIEPFIAVLRKAHEKCPELRICQLIENATTDCFGPNIVPIQAGECLYYLSNEQLVRYIERFIEPTLAE